MTIANLRGDIGSIKLITPNEEQMEEEDIAEQMARRPNFNFSMLQIPVGSELKFVFDETCVCYTKDMNNKVEYNGVEYTLSGLAQALIAEKRGVERPNRVAGPRYFIYQGNTIAELRFMKERGEAE